MQQADIWLFKQINTGLANPMLDALMLVASAFGTGAAQVGIALTVTMFGWVLNRVDLRRSGYAGVIACAAAGIFVQLVKALWNRPRPLAVVFDARAVGAPLFSGSFPSGHATTAFAVAVAMSSFVPKAGYVLIPLALLVSVSRIYVGVHFPVDIVFGAVLGTLIGAGCAQIMRSRTSSSDPFLGRKEGRTLFQLSSDSNEDNEYPGLSFAKRRVWSYALLFALCVMLFLWRLGAVPLMGLDEGLYAECAREMAAGGSWIVPTVNGLPFFDKPPLVYWLMALSIRAFGTNSFAVRLPSCLAGLVLVGMTVYLGVRLFGARAGLFAGFVLATSILTVGLARMAVMDMVFALAITVSLGMFLLARLRLAPWWVYLVSCAAAGLSTLIKGPAGVILIGSTIAVFVAIQRARRVKRERAKNYSGLGLAAAGVAVFLLTAMPWYVAVHKATAGEFVREFFIHQNLQRALGEDFHHNMPFYFYVPAFLFGFFPWSVFVPLAWAKHVRLRPADFADQASLFAGIWMVAMILIFSISRSKLPAYIYPVYPASALLVGRLWSRLIEKQDEQNCQDYAQLGRYAIALIVLTAVFASALILAPRFIPRPIAGAEKALGSMALAMVAGTTAFSILLYQRMTRLAFAALVVGASAFALTAVRIGLPVASRTLGEPAVAIAKAILRHAPPDVPIFAYHLSRSQVTLPFYARRPVLVETGKEEMLRSARGLRSFVVVAERNRLNELPDGGRLLFERGQYVVYLFER
ncbi:MAG: phosphatase PAP2 family protein [Armatimonadetes bacterium]|nr:phosphatase PAP2 family protein [Armatimonadota bacterium]